MMPPPAMLRPKEPVGAAPIPNSRASFLIVGLEDLATYLDASAASCSNISSRRSRVLSTTPRLA